MSTNEHGNKGIYLFWSIKNIFVDDNVVSWKNLTNKFVYYETARNTVHIVYARNVLTYCYSVHFKCVEHFVHIPVHIWSFDRQAYAFESTLSMSLR